MKNNNEMQSLYTHCVYHSKLPKYWAIEYFSFIITNVIWSLYVMTRLVILYIPYNSFKLHSNVKMNIKRIRFLRSEPKYITNVNSRKCNSIRFGSKIFVFQLNDYSNRIIIIIYKNVINRLLLNEYIYIWV